MDVIFSGKPSPVQRLFSQFEPHQLQEVNNELAWNCGICLETAEDPCVTRCGHLYCRSHLKNWLSNNPSCPSCKAFCTPAQDIVPIFSRESSFTLGSQASSCSSPCLRSPSPERGPPAVPQHSWETDSPSSLARSHTQSWTQPQSFIPHIYVHYLGIALRVLGLALLLKVLLSGGYFANPPSSNHPTA